MRVQSFYIHQKELAVLESLTKRDSSPQQSRYQLPSPPRWIFSINEKIIDNKHNMMWGTKFYRQRGVPKEQFGRHKWRIPTLEEVTQLLDDKTFPLYSHRGIANVCSISTQSGHIYVNNEFPQPATNSVTFPCIPFPFSLNKEYIDKLLNLKEHSLKALKWAQIFEIMYKLDGLDYHKMKEANPAEMTQTIIDALGQFLTVLKNHSKKKNLWDSEIIQRAIKDFFHATSLKVQPQSTPPKDIVSALLRKENMVCRLPVLDQQRLKDPQLGIYEIALQHPPSKEYQKIDLEESFEATDFSKHVQENSFIAIDFGSNSTLVGKIQNKHIEFIRIGVEDWNSEIKSEDFENPTYLRLLSKEFVDIWNSIAHRPPLLWEQIQCSHAVRRHLNDISSTTNVHSISSVLPHLKIWAQEEREDVFRFHDDAELTLSTSRGSEIHNQRHIALTEASQIDPLELYAWFIGMNINVHHRGLHTQYIMTFPVFYPHQLRSRILSAFKKGLARSLPSSFWHSENAVDFTVQEIANEPTAFAIGALKHHKLYRTKEPIPFAVFDFGGGTTDFAFGIWRPSTKAEIADGYRYTLELLTPSGDVHLGGEKLLWNLAYQIYEQNKTLMLQHKIPFLNPPQSQKINGLEQLIGISEVARANTTIMIEKFRPIWEASSGEEELNDDHSIPIQLFAVSGENIDISLRIKRELLEKRIEDRIKEGVNSFLYGLQQAFYTKKIDTLHIFLAGNSSKSKFVHKMFHSSPEKENTISSWMNSKWSHTPQDITIHPITKPDDTLLQSTFTCKSGVVVGLLHLITTPSILILQEQSQEATSFTFFLGYDEDDYFIPKITSFDNYNTWHCIDDIIPATKNFVLYYSSNPQAMDELELPDNRILSLVIEGPTEPSVLFIKAKGHNKISYAWSQSKKDIPEDEIEELTLKE